MASRASMLHPAHSWCACTRSQLGAMASTTASQAGFRMLDKPAVPDLRWVVLHLEVNAKIGSMAVSESLLAQHHS